MVQGCVCQEQKGSGVTGLREFTVKGFHNNFIDLIEQEEKQTSVAGLLASFYDQRTLDYLVVYLQLLASGFLHHDSGSLNTSSKVGKLLRSSASRKWRPCTNRVITSTFIALAQALNVPGV